MEMNPKVLSLMEQFSSAIADPIADVKPTQSEVLEAMLRQAGMYAHFVKLPKTGTELQRMAEAVAEARGPALFPAPFAEGPLKLNIAPACKGIDLGDGKFSGCTGEGNDCPECGK